MIDEVRVTFGHPRVEVKINNVFDVKQNLV